MVFSFEVKRLSFFENNAAAGVASFFILELFF